MQAENKSEERLCRLWSYSRVWSICREDLKADLDRISNIRIEIRLPIFEDDPDVRIQSPEANRIYLAASTALCLCASVVSLPHLLQRQQFDVLVPAVSAMILQTKITLARMLGKNDVEFVV